MSYKLTSIGAALRSISLTIVRLASWIEVSESGAEHAAVKRSLPDPRLIERNAPLLAAIARTVYESRRRRCHYLEPDLFGEPAWDLLLDLFIQKAHGRRTSTTSAAIAAGAPLSTALRHVAALERAGLIEREKSRADGRVTYIDLTGEGFCRVGAFLQERVNASWELP